ncbi:chondroitin sulfate proteoglycan 5b isoform X2 [Gadus morhua]|uniref:chondroitin sulfate proteoglycan 5b isoform X2 n=1 Tax=Gadus morhua TaxID=8049 RepID=UPI0011B57F28|nr:chondroitin sulfate proteoglycan 5-like isoform X2 [Gadus morhua]
MDDENPRLPAAPVVPQKVKPLAGAGRPSAPVPPLRGGPGPGRGRGQVAGGPVGTAGGDGGCRLGFVSSRPGVCTSQCDAQPDFCYNGGVCTVVAGTGAFCRCNVQEYIWNKGTRCDWSITEFQVMCVVIGGASLVLIILFMIVVFFAKKLHQLKNENRRLRKRSKYRPQSTEPQTDGMSVSTTADGSQPNVRKLCDTPPPPPPAHAHNLAYYDNIICQEDRQKKEELTKTPTPKEEESMNIRNSHPSPQAREQPPVSVEQERGPALGNSEESMEGGVTIGLELLLPQEAGLRPETSPPLEYEVFLYKLPANGEPHRRQSTPSPLNPPEPPSPLNLQNPQVP